MAKTNRYPMVMFIVKDEDDEYFCLESLADVKAYVVNNREKGRPLDQEILVYNLGGVKKYVVRAELVDIDMEAHNGKSKKR